MVSNKTLLSVLKWILYILQESSLQNLVIKMYVCHYQTKINIYLDIELKNTIWIILLQ